MRISDWNSDVCSSDLPVARPDDVGGPLVELRDQGVEPVPALGVEHLEIGTGRRLLGHQVTQGRVAVLVDRGVQADVVAAPPDQVEDPPELHAELKRDTPGLGLTAEAARKRVM